MKAISLLSSGIDSPVATYVLSSYVDEMIVMHADARPFTDDAEIAHFQSIASHLSSLMSTSIRSCLVPHGDSLRAYNRLGAHPRFICVFCKRMMVRYAEALAQKLHGDCIIMGDSLGQVASQTLANLSVVDKVSSLPILRPLIGFDKEEIVNIAKKIGTYDLSIRKTQGCIAVPDKPATQARIEQLLAIEGDMNIQDLIETAINNISYV